MDNGSTDGTRQFIRAQYPATQLLSNNRNRGVGPARNQGIQQANGRYILLFDDDAEVRGDGLEKLLDFMETRPEVGICGGKLVSPDGELQYSCRGDTTPWTILYRRSLIGKLFPNSKVLTEHLMLDYDHREAREVDWVQGACLMIRREIIDLLGPLKHYFHGPEDQEICFRAKSHGWKVYYYPKAEFVHQYSRLSAKGINRFTVIQLKEMIDFLILKRRSRRRMGDWR